jgi:hypothetical protein
MNSIAFTAVAIGAMFTFTGCAEYTSAPISLANSVQPLRDRFNADRNRPRFLAILSPT